ncbi:MAG: hypothetical protein MMC33_008369 [Icmadophila ericetorum]|nr:hypothetical protein [Icmadophila ericetorum]
MANLPHTPINSTARPPTRDSNASSRSETLSSQATSKLRRKLSDLSLGVDKLVGKFKRRLSSRSLKGQPAAAGDNKNGPWLSPRTFGNTSTPTNQDHHHLNDANITMLTTWYTTQSLTRIKTALLHHNKLNRTTLFIFTLLYCWILDPPTSIPSSSSAQIYETYKSTPTEDLEKILKEAWKDIYDYTYPNKHLARTRYINPENSGSRATDLKGTLHILGVVKKFEQAGRKVGGAVPYVAEDFQTWHFGPDPRVPVVSRVRGLMMGGGGGGPEEEEEIQRWKLRIPPSRLVPRFRDLLVKIVMPLY